MPLYLTLFFPLMLVKKMDASPDKPILEQYQVVHDYHKLNENTVHDCYPMCNLYELLDSVAQAKIWSVIDLSLGFWNQELTQKSKPYMAFGVPSHGHWEYNCSMQGLTNSPTTFQRLLDFILKDLPGVYVYIDVIIICSNSHEEHLKLLQVLQYFRHYHLKCKVSKMQIGTGEVHYLAYISHQHRIHLGALKTEAIKNWPLPKSVTKIRQFLGLCSFFHRTIPHFSTIANSLTKLIRKDAKWKLPYLPTSAAQACSRTYRPVSLLNPASSQ